MKWLVIYRVYIRLRKHGYDITAPLDAWICSWREWETLIGIRSDKENLPFDTENKVSSLQLLWFSSFAYLIKGIETVLLCLYSLIKTLGEVGRML